MDLDEIVDLVDYPDFSKDQAIILSNAIYKKRIEDLMALDRIPKRIRERIVDIAFTGISPPVSYVISADGSKKYLFKNSDGLLFETVYIPDGKRNTVCVSVQSGCRMGCPFCATAMYGFRGDLPVSDIVNQVLGIDEAATITHIVFMGMGEPMDNLDNVLKAINIFTSEWGIAIGRHKITVSTVGLAPGIVKYLKESRSNITVSLFSPFADEREKIVPVEKKYPVKEIVGYLKNISLEKGRRITLSYMIIKGINDSDKHLEGLVELIQGSKIRVNLLMYHKVSDCGYEPVPYARMQFFKNTLLNHGISASVRKSRGDDIFAACGQLAVNYSSHN